MNVFYVDRDPYDAAKALVDKHVVKMVLESAQLLSTAHRMLDGVTSILCKYELFDERQDLLYRVTHMNHPSNVWCRTSVENYLWLADHFHGLLQEYTHRYSKTHKCAKMLYVLGSPPLNLKEFDFTEPPQCMPDEFKVSGDSVAAYRNYYRLGKEHLHKYTRREAPDWLYDTNITHTN